MAAKRSCRSLAKLSTFVFLGLLAGGRAPVRAEALTWEQTVQMMAAANPDLLAAVETLRSSQSQVKGAYSGFLPQLSASLSYNYGAATVTPSFGGETPVPSLGPTTPGPDLFPSAVGSTYSASLSGTETLFSGFLDKGRVDQASANERASRAALETARAKASYELKSAFAAVLYAKSAIALNDIIIKRREDNLRLVELRFRSGRENRGSLLLSRSYLAQANFETLQARNQLVVARQQLARVVGLEELGSLELAGTVPTRAPEASVDFAKLVLEAPEYRQSAAQEESSDAAVTIARAAFFPILAVTGTTSNTGARWFPSGNVWSVQVGISFPFFSGGKDYFATRSAVSTWRAASHTKEGTLFQTLIRLKQLYTAYVEAVEKLKVDRGFAEAAEVRERIGRAKYNNGLLSFEDWDIIENDYIARQKALLESERDRVTAEAAWEQVQGKGVLM